MLQYSPLAYPSLENLSYILRNRGLWPKDFVWDFKNCKQCALGLVDQLWADYPKSVDDMYDSMSGDAELRIFYNAWTKPPVIGWLGLKRERRYDEVTPEMVADQIDEYLKRREGIISHDRTTSS